MNNFIQITKENQEKETALLEQLTKQIKQLEEQENIIKNLLGITDPNINIIGIPLEKNTKHGKVKILQAKLTYIPKKCEYCETKNKNEKIVVKNGFDTITVKMGRTTDKVLLELKLTKQKFKCKKCKKIFRAKTTIVEKNKNISNNIAKNIAVGLLEVRSLKNIGKEYGISINSVQRILEELGKTTKTPKTLPEHLSFDELKTTKDAAGHMSFIYTNAKTHEVLDIVMDRKLYNLKEYFRKISRKERKKVKTITIDMYQPYISLITELFPNAEIIIDKFHIIQHINREFNKLRIKVMNSYKYSNRKLYTKYKKYWKLLLKDMDLLVDDIMYMGKEMAIQREFVIELIKENSQLEKSYHVMQGIRESLKNGDYNQFLTIINERVPMPKGIRKALTTFKKYAKYIKNTMAYPEYTNGHIEGINNKLKLIKRVAYGYRKFKNFRLRALIIFRVLKQDNISKKVSLAESIA